MTLMRQIWQTLFQPTSQESTAIAQPSPEVIASRRRAGMVLLLALALLFAFRLTVFVRGPYISSDSKNYLATMNQVWGEDFTGYGLDRPPLIAVPLKLASLVFGPITGSQVLGALISVLIALPFWLIAKRLVAPWPAAIGTFLFASSPMYTEMLAWGYITFFGILFSLLTFYYLLRAFQSPHPKWLLLGGLMASLVMGFHQTSLVVMLIIMALWLAMLLLPGGPPRRRAIAAVAVTGVVGLVLALPYFPSYFSQANQLSNSYVSSLGHLRTLSQVGSRAVYFFGRQVPLWLLTLPLIVLGAREMARRHRLGGTLAVAILLAAIGLNLFDAADPADRSAYLAFSGLWLVATVGLDWLVGRVRLFNGRLWPRLALAALIGYIGYAEYVTNASLSALAQYYDSMDAGEVAAADWLDTTDLPLHDGIAAHPGAFADWIRGLAARNAYSTVAPIRGAWIQQTEQAQAAIAVLSGQEALDNGNLHVSTGYPGIDTTWLMVSAYVLSYGSGQTTADLLYLNESKATIAYSVAGSDRSVTFADALSIESHVEEADDRISLISVYQFPDFSVERTVRLKYGERKLALKYEFHGDDVTFERLTMPVKIPTGRVRVKTLEEGVDLIQQHAFGQTTCRIAMDESDIRDWDTDLDEYDTGGNLILKFNSANPTARFSERISTPNSVIEAPLRHDVTPTIMEEQNIHYVAFDQTPPGTADGLSEAVFDWVDSVPYYFPIYRDDDVYIYRVLDAEEQAPQHSVTAYLGDEIALRGWTLLDGGQPRFDQLSLELFWSAAQTPTHNYKVFVHVTDAQGQLVAQDDSMPGRWRRPTTIWEPDELVTDQHRIKLSDPLPAGEYTLSVGMYDSDTGERLPLYDAAGQLLAEDTLLLTTIQVQD